MLLKIKLALFIIFFSISSIFLNTTYRAYIYKNELSDFGLADVGYNLFAVSLVTLTLWFFSCNPTNNKILDIVLCTMIYISLEIMSFFFELFGVFDVKDILALFVSCLITIFLLYFIDKCDFILIKNDFIKKINCTWKIILQ